MNLFQVPFQLVRADIENSHLPRYMVVGGQFREVIFSFINRNVIYEKEVLDVIIAFEF